MTGEAARSLKVADPNGVPHQIKGHVPALDGLRGIAILLVMLDHFSLYGGMIPSHGIDKLYYEITLAGWVGVDLFFVLSGFLITGLLIDARDKQGFFRIFYARRILRIFPLYYGVLLFVFIVAPQIGALRELFLPYQDQQCSDPKKLDTKSAWLILTPLRAA